MVAVSPFIGCIGQSNLSLLGWASPGLRNDFNPALRECWKIGSVLSGSWEVVAPSSASGMGQCRVIPIYLLVSAAALTNDVMCGAVPAT